MQAISLNSLLAENNLLLQDGDRRFFQRFGLSQARFYALLHVQQDPGISLTELSKRLLCTKGNATRILAGLAADGLLSRLVDPIDQRAYRLELSAAGYALIEQVREAYTEYNRMRFAILSPAQTRQLTEYLGQLNEALRAHLL